MSDADAADLAAVLASWNAFDPLADQDGDGFVDAFDLTYILAFWGGDCGG